MSKVTLWLRCEKKIAEHRSALTPTTAKKLIDAGFEVMVEKDVQRIFGDSEYEKQVYFGSSCLSCSFNGVVELDANLWSTIPGQQHHHR
jgi:NAD/NADP transhydrogenase alpha subunit